MQELLNLSSMPLILFRKWKPDPMTLGIKDSFPEKRKHLRLSLHYPVRYRKETQTDFIETKSGNISFGGLMFIALQPIHVGDTIELEMTYQQLDSSKTIELSSRVIWVDDSGWTAESQKEYFVGVQFKSTNQDQKEVLSKLLKNYNSFI